MCKKCKLNISVNDNTYPSPNKAITQNKIELNNKFNSEMIQGKDIKKSCNEQIVTNNNDVSNDDTNVSRDNITMKKITQKENTKDQLGVMALIAIMEPVTESQSLPVQNQRLKVSRPEPANNSEESPQ